LAGGDVAETPFLPGGFMVLGACYGGGTPRESAYAHWLSALSSAGVSPEETQAVLRGLPKGGERPFVARLPQALLSNPAGPLAMVAHIDLAWTYSFQDLDSGSTNRPAKFVQALRTALDGHRFGIAFREIYRFFDRVNTELTALYDQSAAARAKGGGEVDRLRMGHLWMLRQDLAGYALLGDPAAALLVPRRSAQPSAATPQQASWSSLIPGASGASAASAVAEPKVALPIAIDRLEEAIGHVLAGDRGLNAIAGEYGVEKAQLTALAERYAAAGRKALTG
jgi:hypothetical protein